MADRIIYRNQRAILVNTLIVLNAIVYIMWHSNTFPQSFMEENFLVSFSALTEGRYWTLITAVFSHNMLWHILINMFVLKSFGSLLEQVLGRLSFITFYFVAGVVSSLVHCVVSAYILHAPALSALGASGAISGLVLVFALMFPRERLLIFGIIPVPALWGALGFIALDLWGLHAQAGGGGLPIGHGAHLGGAFTGILYYYLFIRPGRARRRAEQIP